MDRGALHHALEAGASHATQFACEVGAVRNVDMSGRLAVHKVGDLPLAIVAHGWRDNHGAAVRPLGFVGASSVYVGVNLGLQLIALGLKLGRVRLHFSHLVGLRRA